MTRPEPPVAVPEEIDLADELELLEGWREGFAALYGEAPRLEPYRDPDGVGGDGLYRLVFPSLFDQFRDLVGRPEQFQQVPEMVAYFRRLGFQWGDDGKILTVPIASTFNRLRVAHGPPDCGYTLVYRVEDAECFSGGLWLRNYLDGRLPIHLGSSDYYRRTTRGGDDSLMFHFASMVHDLGLHAVNYNLIPHSCIAAMRDRIRTALPDRWRDWRRPGASAPLTLTLFLDNDVNRYCYEVWFRARRPDGFGAIFEADFDQLLAALDVRIDETREGKGDGPGDGPAVMRTLRPTTFDLSGFKPAQGV